MEPLVALSAAGTIVQFVEFGTKLLREGKAFYKSSQGSLTVNDELELVTHDLQALVAKMRQEYSPLGPVGNLNESEQEDLKRFNMICKGSADVAEELIRRLAKLKVTSKKFRKWESLKKAIGSAWSRDEIKELVARLEGFKQALDGRLLLSLRKGLDEQSVLISARFDSLEKRNQEIITALLEQSKTISTNHLPEENTVLTIIHTLAQLINRLDIIDGRDHSFSRKYIAARLDNATASDPAELNEQALTTAIELLSVPREEEMKLQNAVKDKILHRLYFSTMSTRYEKVIDAYPQTFKWIFRGSPEGKLPWSNFAAWLKMKPGMSDGIYWISGKAGSGKTTLMKHILEDPQTKRCLLDWAGGNQILIASYFAWGSGTDDQKTQAGLLRALLFQVLSEEPGLIPIVLPDEWSRIYTDLLDINGTTTYDPTTVRQLLYWFNNLIKQSAIPLKILFLVDGLDELDGDHDDIIHPLLSSQSYENIKICLSSRPWQIFEDFFNSGPMLKLQNLTNSDIVHFVTDKFTRNRAFSKLAAREPDSAPSLMGEIVARADGVFLWVRLVVKTLLDGIRNRDDMDTLWMKLRALPRDLELLYAHLLGLINPVDLPWASSAFQIVRAAIEVQGDKALTMEIFHLAINTSIRPKDIPGLPKKPQRYEDTAVQLVARGAGMLEVFQRPGEDLTDSLIVYLHTTVADFLATEKFWPQLVAHTAATKFNPYLSMTRAMVLDLQEYLGKFAASSLKFPLDFDFMNTRAKGALRFASWANLDPTTHRMLNLILEHLDRQMKHHSTKTHHWGNYVVELHGREPIIKSFLDLATLFNISAYVTEKLPPRNDSESNLTVSYLLNLLLPSHELLPSRDRISPSSVPVPTTTMISTLLRFGADPNWSLKTHSTWENILIYLIAYSKVDDEHRHLQVPYINAMELLLEGGADPRTNSYIQKRNSPSPVQVVLQYVCPKWPKEGASILEKLRGLLSPEEYESCLNEGGSKKEDTTSITLAIEPPVTELEW